ncbi:YuzL family protein [Bacillus sp. mrc49]|nr:YuzL family protein [Bacillus sp. mrc49]PJN89698.1 YuzL family protein [Bacillus sp. mrc49]
MNGKNKKDATQTRLGSSQIEGQGTTTKETGSFNRPSSLKKQKRS